MYIVGPSVLSLNNLKLHKNISSEKHFCIRKLILWLPFNLGKR